MDSLPWLSLLASVLWQHGDSIVVSKDLRSRRGRLTTHTIIHLIIYRKRHMRLRRRSLMFHTSLSYRCLQHQNITRLIREAQTHKWNCLESRGGLEVVAMVCTMYGCTAALVNDGAKKQANAYILDGDR